MAKLGEVCKVSPSTKNIKRQSAWLLNLDMVEQQTGRVIEYKYAGEDDLNGSIIQFDTENVLYSKLRPNLNKVVLPEKDGFSTSELLPLRPDASVLNRDYLAVFLRSDSFVTWAVSKTAGAKMPRLGTKDLMNAEIPVPNIERQKEIAEKFKKLEQLISLRKQQLAKLDELVKARFVEMFGDPVKNTMDWEIKPLSELGELNRGVSKARPRNSPELLGGPYPLIQTGEVANAKTYITSFNSTYTEKGLAQSKMWPKGTLCITIAANIAQTSILTFDACFPDSVVGFISRNMTNELFIHYWFSFFQKILDEQAPQVAQKNINLKILSELNVIVPPLSLQNRFAAFVEHVDQQKQTVQQSLEKLELMKKALMQEYFG